MANVRLDLQMKGIVANVTQALQEKHVTNVRESPFTDNVLWSLKPPPWGGGGVGGVDGRTF